MLISIMRTAIFMPTHTPQSTTFVMMNINAFKVNIASASQLNKGVFINSPHKNATIVMHSAHVQKNGQYSSGYFLKLSFRRFQIFLPIISVIEKKVL